MMKTFEISTKPQTPNPVVMLKTFNLHSKARISFCG